MLIEVEGNVFNPDKICDIEPNGSGCYVNLDETGDRYIPLDMSPVDAKNMINQAIHDERKKFIL